MPLRDRGEFVLRSSEGGRVDVTTQYLSRMERRIDRFEEMIAAIKAKL